VTSGDYDKDHHFKPFSAFTVAIKSDRPRLASPRFRFRFPARCKYSLLLPLPYRVLGMTSNSSWRPDEDEATILLERNFLAGDLICGVGYGIQLVLYTSCATYLWKHRKDNRNNILLLAYITLLLTVETIFVIVQGRTVQVIYIDNRNYPGGPWQYFLDTQYLAINVMFYATFFVLTFLSDLLVVRCSVCEPVGLT